MAEVSDMIGRAREEIDDVLPPQPDGELVRWMPPRPPSLGLTGVSLAAAGAFVLGVAATVMTMEAARWLGARRRLKPTRRSGRWGIWSRA